MSQELQLRDYPIPEEKTMKLLIKLMALVGLIIPGSAVLAETPETYQFPRKCSMTDAGYSVPLCGKPITKTPVVASDPGSDNLKVYPEYFIPDQEKLAADEMRLTAVGSGNPPVRRGQASTSWLVELGNGDKFIIDAGGGTVPALWSLRVPLALLDKLFLTHLHLDHAGGIFNLWDSMGWARNTPLHVWGASGSTPELGVAAFVENVRKAGAWQTRSKTGIIASGGMELTAHEFDSAKFSPENPRMLVYSENGVKIYAFPVDHILIGAVGYRLEWNGLSVVYTGDSIPTVFESEQAHGVDVFIHELFIDAPTFAEKNNMPLMIAENVIDEHTSAEELGRVFSIAQPRLGVGTHYFTNDYTIDPAFKGIRKNYQGPVVIAQDLMVINVTPEQITTRMAKTDLLSWAAPAPMNGPPPKPDPAPTEGRTPEWVQATRFTME
ncbi:MAG: MBL fold metallo-hydrolase [Woeseia sp.]|nr:MBL fold metallo-hydrolase [Woeseia sp.]